MTSLIRRLIRESVLELREGFADDVLGGISSSMEPDALSELQGREFASTLKADIPELGGYALVDYLPLGATKEKWVFDVETSHGILNNVTVVHIIGEAPLWKFIFGTAQPSMERMVSDISYRTDLMSYSDMVERVNADWRLWG